MVSERKKKMLRDAVLAELQTDEEMLAEVFNNESSLGEQVIVVLTDRRVIACTKQPLGSSSATISWDYEQITAIGTGKNPLEGTLVFSVPGDRFMMSVSRAAADKFRRTVEDRLQAAKTGGASSTSTDGADVETRLARLVSLRDGGLITDEEFQSKRESILKSL